MPDAVAGMRANVATCGDANHRSGASRMQDAQVALPHTRQWEQKNMYALHVGHV
jgi:hypothetical protein